MLSVQIGKTLEGRALKLKQVIEDYPITCAVSVNGLLANFAVAFTAPTFAVFALLFTGAVLVKGRHTVTRMILAAGIRAAHHARFHRFFSQARWEMDRLWERLVRLIVERLTKPGARIEIVIDETAQKKTGAKIYGVGLVHDNRPAARKGWNLSWGLTWVVLTLRIRVPLWGGHVFAVPVMARLCRKEKYGRDGGHLFRTKAQLAWERVERLVSWVSGCRIRLYVDGGYADGKFMKALPPNVEVVGRLRHDAALYGLPPKRRAVRGRPRQHGRRLPNPRERVTRRPGQWTLVELPNGKCCEVQTWVALWWKVFGARPIRVVASRVPGRPETVQFFYTTQTALTPAEALSGYADRWAVEGLFHEVKERMGFEDPQCRTERAVERTTPFLLWTAGGVQYGFLSRNDPGLIGWRPRGWSHCRRTERPPSFAQMQAALRREILTGAFSQRSASKGALEENLRALIETAAYAA